MQSHHVILNGHPCHYLEWGPPDAPILLMLHGFPEYSGAWAELAQRLSDRFRCIAPDQRGYGQSWAPADVRDYATGKLVGDMAAMIDHLGGGPVTVIGHDWGASVAYVLAARHPERVGRLIILNGVHPIPFQREMAKGGAQSAASQYILWLRREGSEDRLAAGDFAKLMDLFSAKMDLSWMTAGKLAEYKAEWGRPGRMRGMVNWYRASPLQVAPPGQPITDLPALPRDQLGISQPHLLIWGTGDTALLTDCLDGLQDYAPDLTIHRIDGADHWICHQKPDEVAAIIRDWLG
ncbi:MAG: alpha/beta hydrolase [Rhodobacterales bacterium]|nr:alpha/beta hydrolase [Rhodobacterales bacterium]MDX5389939.1 alpha/beta hydrolase [Rhodobacterales bacterium]MDX5489630.1 alpha/beta hydrolase [Rhodobacterales bacterium]